jgi:stage II sporulation protein D
VSNPSVRDRARRRLAPAAAGLLLAAIVCLAPACASRPGGPAAGAGGNPPGSGAAEDRERGRERPALPAQVTVRVAAPSGGRRVVTLPLEVYVLGAVRAEVLPSTLRAEAARPALDVQAIVSRTYAVANLGRHAADGFDLCDTTHCQVYREAVAGEGPSDAAARAVDATRGRVLTFQGRPIQALFHAECGGHTASAASVWGGTEAPYLESVTDWFCARRQDAGWTFAADAAAIARALNGDARTRVGDRLQRINIAARDASGRALAVTLVGTRTLSERAEVFRAVMTQAFGARSIRSTWFDVTRDASRLRFTGVGYGHGVGLCQTGTALRAAARQSPAEILAHYFPGTQLRSGRTATVRPDLAARLLGRP